ncbi:hypothetical protein ACHAWT_007114 [Skeletonema menzelii]
MQHGAKNVMQSGHHLIKLPPRNQR